MTPGEAGESWSVVATVVEAAAVVGATVLAAIALVKQSDDEEARRRSTDAAQHLRTLGSVPARLARPEEEGGVEERLQRAIAAAPHASAPVGKAIRKAYALYYQARWQRPTWAVRSSAQTMRVGWTLGGG
jgi:hypothetical protein